MAGINKTVNVGEGLENLEPSYIAGGLWNGAPALENSLAVPQNVKHKGAIFHS